MYDMKRQALIRLANGARIPFPFPGDYLIVNPDLSTGKRELALTMAIRGVDKKGRITHPRHAALKIRYERGVSDPENDTTTVIDPEHVVMNLGPTPPEGKTVLGVRTDYWRGSIDHDLVPHGVHMYVDLDTNTKSLLQHCLDEAQRIWEKNKLPPLPMRIEIRRPSGTAGGTYKKNKEDTPDVLTLKPKRWDRNSNLFTILHEMGHGLDFNYVPVTTRVEWLAKYHEQVSVVEAEKKALQRVCRGFLQHGIDYDPEGDDAELYEQAVEYIETKHLVRWKDLQVALNTMEGQDLIKSIWPRREDLSNSEPSVTDYALKNVHEFFAETVAMTLFENPAGEWELAKFAAEEEGTCALPKDVKSLMKHTFKVCRA